MSGSSDLVVRRPAGLYCPAGDFYIDPMRAVDRAVITHAHSDHARRGHGAYLCAQPGAGVLQARLGRLPLQTVSYGQALTLGAARVSLHPAGHVLGSAQVRIEVKGEVWVVSGDYFALDPAVASLDHQRGMHHPCQPLEPLPCHVFVTESTFALPIYRWQPASEVFADILQWWRDNAASGQLSLVQGYSLGKAQHLQWGLALAAGHAGQWPGPLWVHPTVAAINQAYLAEGWNLPDVHVLGEGGAVDPASLVIAPPSALTMDLLPARTPLRQALASGWMQTRARRQGRGLDRGFALSDHADWPGLMHTIAATGATRVIVHHGREDVLIHHLRGQGLQAHTFATGLDVQQDRQRGSA